MKRMLLTLCCILLGACQAFNHGDDVSDAAKLTIKSDGQAIPSEPASNLLSRSVAFKIGPGIELESQRALPDSGLAVILNKGKVYVCIDQKVDNIWNCSGFAGNPRDGAINFNLLSGGTVIAYAIADSKLPMRSGDVLIDPNALRIYISEIDPATREESNRVARQLTYLKQTELATMKLLDTANKGEPLDLSASVTADIPPAKIDDEALKRQVITQVAVEHNFNPQDVVGYDASVVRAAGQANAYTVRGKFQVESDTPSNVYEAASARVNQNICMVSPDDCAGKKYKHTVEFEANVKEYTKLDGSHGLNIEDQVAVDKPLHGQVSQKAEAQQKARLEGTVYVCKTPDGVSYGEEPGPGCKRLFDFSVKRTTGESG